MPSRAGAGTAAGDGASALPGWLPITPVPMDMASDSATSMAKDRAARRFLLMRRLGRLEGARRPHLSECMFDSLPGTPPTAKVRWEPGGDPAIFPLRVVEPSGPAHPLS